MRRKQSRYSSSLATDWVIPSPVHEASAPQTPVERESLQDWEDQVPSGPVQLRSDSKAIAGQPNLSNSRVGSRYKKTFPLNWVASDAESTPIAAGQAPKTGAMGEPLLPQPAELSAQRTSKPPTRHILTSQSPRIPSETTPPPAPTEAIEMSLPIRGATPKMQRQIPSVPVVVARPSSRFGRTRSRSNQRSYFQPPSHSTTSTPTSVGRSSSAVTDSSSYGRDQPAMPPSVSPSYSTR